MIVRRLGRQERVTPSLRRKSITGLDIGSTEVRAVIASIIGNGQRADIVDEDFPVKLEIIGVGSAACIGVQKGSVVDVAATISAIEQAVDSAVSQAGIGMNIEAVYVGITGTHIASLVSTGHITLPNGKNEITAKMVASAVESSKSIVIPPDREVIHSIPRSYSVDGHEEVQRPVGMFGTRLEVHTNVIHGVTTVIRNLEKCVIGAGLDIAETVLEPLAVSESVLLPHEKDSGVCLLDIGGSSTDLAVFVDGKYFHSALLPIGGKHVTNDVAYGLTVESHEAERLKIENGCALEELVPPDDVVSIMQVGKDTSRKLRRKALIQIIEPRIQELFQYALDELTLAECLTKCRAGVVLTGGGSQMAGIAELASRVLNLPVRIGVTGGINGTEEQLSGPRYAAAIGLALYGASKIVPAPAAVESGPQETSVGSLWSQLVRTVTRGFPRS